MSVSENLVVCLAAFLFSSGYKIPCTHEKESERRASGHACMKVPQRVATGTGASVAFNDEDAIEAMVLVPGGTSDLVGYTIQASPDKYSKYKVTVMHSP